ncbi:MAG: hypothetical protein ABJB47_02365 [Actinomycetota bacterium]
MAVGSQEMSGHGAAVAVASLCLVQFVDVLGVTVVVTSLPHMLADLHAPGAAGSLVATGYAMFFGGLLMLGARRFVFWAYLPLTVALVLAITRSAPADHGADDAAGSGSLNLAGWGLFTAAVMAFVVGSTAVAQAADRLAGVLLLAASAVLVAAFAVVDRRAAAPLLPAELLHSVKLRLGAAGGFLNTATTSSVITLVTLYLQNTLRRSPLEAAITLLPFSLAVIAGSALSARVQRRISPAHAVAIGLAVIAVADLALIPSAQVAWAVPACGRGWGWHRAVLGRRHRPRHRRRGAVAGECLRHHQHGGPARHRARHLRTAAHRRRQHRHPRRGRPGARRRLGGGRLCGRRRGGRFRPRFGAGPCGSRASRLTHAAGRPALYSRDMGQRWA